MKTQVKICGLKNKEDVQFAISCGANFIGLILVPNHHNTIDEKDIAPILGQIRQSGCTSVAIFQNQDLYNVFRAVKKYSFDFVQLHGNEPSEYCKDIRKIVPVMKVFAVGNGVPIEDVLNSTKSYQNAFDYVVLDRRIQGSGEIVDLGIARKIASQFPTFIAGGLTPENVSEIVKKVQPFGVDISSGVKTRGLFDKGKVKRFIENARLRSNSSPAPHRRGRRKLPSAGLRK